MDLPSFKTADDDDESDQKQSSPTLSNESVVESSKSASKVGKQRRRDHDFDVETKVDQNVGDAA
jgi:hypothetical protein